MLGVTLTVALVVSWIVYVVLLGTYRGLDIHTGGQHGQPLMPDSIL